MDSYNTLGITKDATMEEVTLAYKRKVNEFKESITDEKRLNIFLREFEKAYEDIKAEKEIYIADNDDIDRIDRDIKDNSLEKEISKSKKRKMKNSSFNKSKDKKLKKDNIRNEDRKSSKVKKEKSSKEKSKNKLILKIITAPFIAIISIIIFLLTIINVISWIASKIIMIAAIAISAIHGYQIYLGQAPDYRIFILCGVSFIIALFLPIILKFLTSIFEKSNKFIKKIAY